MPRFACGDRVYDAVDPRHVGRIVALLDGGVTIRVRWEETGWYSDLPRSDNIKRA